MELQMDPMQLLYYQAPLSAVLLFVLVPIVEPVGRTISHNWSSLDIVRILNLNNMQVYLILGLIVKKI